MPDTSGGHVAVYRDVVNAIRTGGMPRSDVRQATMSLELANAILYSGLTQQPVTLPLDRAAYHNLLGDLIAGRRRL